MAITWVHSSTGVRLPIAEIGAAVADLNRTRERPEQIVLCVDGVHGFAAVDVDLPDLGCDFLADRHPQVALRTARDRSGLVARLGSPDRDHPELLRSATAGSGSPPAATTTSSTGWALDQAFAFHDRIGRSRVVARTVEQATQLKEGIAAIDGLRLVTPQDPEVSAGIVCVEVPSMLPGDAVARLRERGDRGERDALRHVVPAAGTQHRHHARAGRRRRGGGVVPGLISERGAAPARSRRARSRRGRRR